MSSTIKVDNILSRADGRPNFPEGIDVAGSRADFGKVLQVVQASTSTTVTVASTSFSDTGLSASITPISASNKVLVLVSQPFAVRRQETGNYGGIELRRGSTTILGPARDGATSQPFDFGQLVGGSGTNNQEIYTRADLKYLDSPNSTSSVTYSTRGAIFVATNSAEIEFQPTGSAANGTSTIILMEIKG
jgi:hypothetical protein